MRYSDCPSVRCFENYWSSRLALWRAGGDACDVLASLASSCRSAGHCIEWRSESLCPIKCAANMVFRACGPNVVKTCSNYKSYSSLKIEYTAEGCFCPDDMVWLFFIATLQPTYFQTRVVNKLPYAASWQKKGWSDAGCTFWHCKLISHKFRAVRLLCHWSSK